MARKGNNYLGIIILLFFVSFSAKADNNNVNLNANNNFNSNSNENLNGNYNVNLNANSNFNGNINLNSNSANLGTQVFSGEVSSAGILSTELEKDSEPGKVWLEQFGPFPNNTFTFENNKLTLYYEGFGGYLVVDFDEEGNIIGINANGQGLDFGGPGCNGNICPGDDPTCKCETWGYFHVQKPKSLTCNFNCNHSNTYQYTFQYLKLKDSQWSNLDPSNVNKCEDIKLAFNPIAEWFGSLSHECIYKGGAERLYTVDLVSPPTLLSACADKDSCLSSAPEYQLTPLTWGKGIEKVPANFVENTQNSLNAGNDPTIKCEGSQCTPYTSGSRVLIASAPQTSYFGNCRGSAQQESINGRTITTPEVNLDTNEATIPAITSTLNMNVINQPPAVNVSLEKTEVNPGDEVQATCDIIDPDECSDKISKIRWSCYNQFNQSVDCFFNGNGIWREGTYVSDISSDNRSNPYHTSIRFKASQAGPYALTCEAWDDDSFNPLSGLGIAGLSVTAPNSTNSNNNNDVIAQSMRYCTILSDSGNSSTICDNKAEVNYRSYFAGPDFSPTQYEWKCDLLDAPQTGPTLNSIKCSYSNTGIFKPSLRIFDGNSNKWINCASNVSTHVNDKSNCSVLIKKAGSSVDYSNKLQINAGDLIDAKIEKECLDQGETKWSSIGGEKIEGDNSTAEFRFDKGGIGTIQAQISQNGKNIDCDVADVTIKEGIHMGQ